MKTSRTALLAALSLCIASIASADVIVPLNDGDANSGWQAVLPDNVNIGIVVDRVTDSFVRIEISKSFVEAPKGGIFGPITIIFQQILPDDQTVSVIQITDESITNNTGVDWTDYHWLLGDQAAAFNINDTEGGDFSIDPFTNMTWVAAVGWSTSYASAMNVDGGVLADGETFFPGLASGRLYINVNLALENSDFSFAQNPTPEPTSMLLMGLGAVAVIRRKRR